MLFVTVAKSNRSNTTFSISGSNIWWPNRSVRSTNSSTCEPRRRPFTIECEDGLDLKRIAFLWYVQLSWISGPRPNFISFIHPGIPDRHSPTSRAALRPARPGLLEISQTTTRQGGGHRCEPPLRRCLPSSGQTHYLDYIVIATISKFGRTQRQDIIWYNLINYLEHPTTYSVSWIYISSPSFYKK